MKLQRGIATPPISMPQPHPRLCSALRRQQQQPRARDARWWSRRHGTVADHFQMQHIERHGRPSSFEQPRGPLLRVITDLAARRLARGITGAGERWGRRVVCSDRQRGSPVRVSRRKSYGPTLRVCTRAAPTSRRYGEPKSPVHSDTMTGTGSRGTTPLMRTSNDGTAVAGGRSVVSSESVDVAIITAPALRADHTPVQTKTTSHPPADRTPRP